jgi:hypothetical protein
MNMRLVPGFVCLTVLLGGCASHHPLHLPEGVQIVPENGRLRVNIDGRLFTEFCYQDTPRPYFYPVLGPEELPMTRRWPMEPDAEGSHDHPHHRSLWFAYSKVDGQDFWTEGAGPRIVHQKFLAIDSGLASGRISSADNWVGTNGEVVCTDVQTMRIYNTPANERIFDFEVTIQAPPDKAVVFGDDKDGAMAVRVADSMRLSRGKNEPGDGHIVESTGAHDEKAWGKRADWCDYYGPVAGKTVGIAIFDNPANLRHPTHWHVRDYGLFAANPFGIHAFDHDADGGEFTLAAGESMTLRYRFYLHEGDEKQGRVAEHYKEYIRTQAR